MIKIMFFSKFNLKKILIGSIKNDPSRVSNKFVRRSISRIQHDNTCDKDNNKF